MNSLEVPLQLLFRDFAWRIIRPAGTIVFGCLISHTRTNHGSNGSAYYESKGEPKTYVAGYCSNYDPNDNAKSCSNPDCSGPLIHFKSPFSLIKALTDPASQRLVQPRELGALAAFLCLGPKQSEDVYTSTDLSLLAALGHMVSTRLPGSPAEGLERAEAAAD